MLIKLGILYQGTLKGYALSIWMTKTWEKQPENDQCLVEMAGDKATLGPSRPISKTSMTFGRAYSTILNELLTQKRNISECGDCSMHTTYSNDFGLLCDNKSMMPYLQRFVTHCLLPTDLKDPPLNWSNSGPDCRWALDQILDTGIYDEMDASHATVALKTISTSRLCKQDYGFKSYF